MTLLIVDDEPLVLDGLLNGIQWEQLDRPKILVSRSMEQAQAVFAEDTVDILLTDIEMGSDNGLDLIQWVKSFSPDTKCIVLSCHDEFNFAQRAVKLGCFDYVLKPVPYETLTQALVRTERCIRQEKRQLLLESYGKEYVKMIHSDMAEPVAGTLDEATAFIREHIAEDFSVEALAKAVHVSPRHLNRLFRKIFEKTVSEYITQQRMLLAAELLKDPQISVTLVSDRVGYSNYSYFIKQFKKRFGYTPKEYQRNQIN